MAVKVTLEFERVDEAIVALGKLVGTEKRSASQPNRGTATGGNTLDSAPSQPFKRRGRSDKGQPRGSYKVDATTNANVTEGATATTVATPASAVPTAPGVTDTAGTGTTDPRTAAESVAAQQPTSTTPTPAVLAPILTDKDAQAAVSKLFEAKGLQIALQVLSRFGARVVRELQPTQYAEFVQKVNDVLNGGEV